jgi:hypothetical protein
MEQIIFTRASIPHVRAIMVLMLVSLIELLHQVEMGWIPTLKYILSGAHGILQPHLIMLGT